MGIFSNLFGGLFSRNYKHKGDFHPFHMLGTAPQFNDYTRDADKLLAIFHNPALLKVFSLQCDLFSLAKPYVYNKKGVLQPDDEAIKRIHSPNYMQTMQDWLWAYMFWKMCGNAYLYTTSRVVDRDNAPMYWLENHKIEWPPDLDREKDKLILSRAKLSRLLDKVAKYRYEDGTTHDVILKDLLIATDLTNGTGNWFKGFSRIDALFKVISNSEASLDSKNINVRYAGKFLVAGMQKPDDVTRKPMGEDEKNDIEKKVDGDKQVHAIKSMVDIKRFVDDLKVLELDKSYLADYYLIGSMYNIPRDVLEAYQSSTFENQEKARAGHVSYTLEPAGELLGGLLARHWGYDNRGWKITFGWDHLPFTQVFEAERAKIADIKARIFSNLWKLGLNIDEINEFLDTNFTAPKIMEDEPVEQE